MEPGVLQTSWMSANDLLQHLELGDLIEFRRLIGTRIAYTVGYLITTFYMKSYF